MKITTKNAVYVQLNDIAFLESTDLPMLLSVYKKVYHEGYNFFDDSNRYDFVKYEGKEEMNFFDGMDWILDFDEVKDLDDEGLLQFGQSIADKIGEVATEYNSLIKGSAKKKKDKRNNHVDKRKRKRNTEDDPKSKRIRELSKKYELLEFKMYSVRDYLLYKQGYLPIFLPEDPSDMIPELQGKVQK